MPLSFQVQGVTLPLSGKTFGTRFLMKKAKQVVEARSDLATTAY